MLGAVLAAVKAGMPTLAECGGFLYLQDELEDINGETRPMCGALPGHGFRTERLVRFGYLTLQAEKDSLLFRAGKKSRRMSFTTGTAPPAARTSGRKRKTEKTGAAGTPRRTCMRRFPTCILRENCRWQNDL